MTGFMKMSSKNYAYVKYPVLLAILLLSVSGCMRRRMTITSDPPGAMVYVDDYEIGQTPVSHDFTYYGTRTFRLEMDGFETVKQQKNINTPWYEIPPLDFVTDNLTPCEIKDLRQFHFTLQPRQEEQKDDVIARGTELKNFHCPVASGINSAQNSAIPPADYSGGAYNNSAELNSYNPSDPYIGAEPGTLPPPRNPVNSTSPYSNFGPPTTVIE